MVCARSKTQMHIGALMLTTPPAWVHTCTGAATTMVSKKTQSAADTAPKGCFTLEQAAAQGQATGKQPSLLPTALAAPRQIDYCNIKEDDRSPSKQAQGADQVPPLSWLHSQVLSHHTKCHSARTQANHPAHGPQPLPSHSAEAGEQLGLVQVQRYLSLRVWQQ